MGLSRSCLLVPAFLSLCLSFAGCTRPAARVQPLPDWQLQAFAKECEEGDREFAKMYWQGWKNAAESYQKALMIKNEPKVRQKLFDSFMLLTVRSLACQQVNPHWLQPLREILPLVPSQENEAYFFLVDALAKLRQGNEESTSFSRAYDPRLQNVVIPEDAAFDFKSFLHLYFVGELRDFESYRKECENFLATFPQSNLSLYLGQYKLKISDCNDLLRRYPDFYEILACRAQHFLVSKKWGQALRDYQDVQERMPFWTAIPLDMGRIYLFFDEDERALECYEKVIALKPRHGEALFGKGLCLSNMGQLDAANSVFRSMIEKQSLYHGEAYYYLARNHYLLGDKAQSRSLADLARTFIPDSPELLMLSGILYLESYFWDKAESEFRIVADKNDNVGDAHFYLGQIAIHKKDVNWAAASFTRAASCFWLDLEGMEKKRETIAGIEIAEGKKRKMAAKMVASELAYINDSRKKLVLAKELLVKLKRGNEFSDVLSRLEMKKKDLELLQAQSGE